MTSCSLVVTLSENANAERFASWMAAEKEEVVFAVDGGNFGRPLTAVGVQKWWAVKERFFMEQRGWKILEYRIFDIVSDAQVCGHIEVGIFSGADPELNVATAHCGVGAIFAWLLYNCISCRLHGIKVSEWPQWLQLAVKRFIWVPLRRF